MVRSTEVHDALAIHSLQVPDLVVLDLDDGYAANDVALLCDTGQGKVVALSSCTDPGFLGAILDAGVHGFLSKGESEATIAEGLRAVAAGQVFVSDACARRLLAAATSQAVDHAGSAPHRDDRRLSAQDLRVIDLVTTHVAEPLQVIASRMGVSAKALRVQLTAIYAKLGVFGRLGLCAYAMRAGVPHRGMDADGVRP